MAKAKKETVDRPAAEAGKKALSTAFGVLETAGKRMTKFAREGKKKVAATEREQKPKAS